MRTADDMENKAVTPEKSSEIKNKQRFFYPDHQLTVEAETKEEADAKKDQIINEKK